MLWAPVLDVVPGRPMSAFGRAGYLVVQSIVPSFLSLVWIFRPSPPLSPFRLTAEHIAGMSPLLDQQLSGFVAKFLTIADLVDSGDRWSQSRSRRGWGSRRRHAQLARCVARACSGRATRAARPAALVTAAVSSANPEVQVREPRRETAEEHGAEQAPVGILGDHDRSVATATPEGAADVAGVE